MTDTGGPDAKVPIRGDGSVPNFEKPLERGFSIPVRECIGMTVACRPSSARNCLDGIRLYI